MESSLTMSSVPSTPAAAVALLGAVRERGIGVGSGAAGFTGDAFRLTDDVVPGLRVWSPPA